MASRLVCLMAAGAASVLLAACGGSGDKPAAAPGSPEAPLQAQAAPTAAVGADAPRPNAAGASAESGGTGTKAKPGYAKLLDKQTAKPKERFSPCNLVSKAQARAIVGRAIADVTEAPQGPTCIYRSKAAGAGFVTLAVQNQSFTALKRQLRRREAVGVAGRTAYCGTAGQPMLYMSVSDGRVLSVAAPCAVAKRFATTALARLSG
jgi:hypothetical protein